MSTPIRKKKKVGIRDLKAVALKDLGDGQRRAVRGGATYSCGHDDDRCAKLTVATGFVQDEETVIIRSGKVATAKIVPR